MDAVFTDDLADVSGWMPVASGLAELKLSAEADARGHALRLDFDFHGGGGFVVARKECAFTLPESYVLCFEIRGEAPPNKLEIKLADPSGQSVWWYHEDAFAVPAEWRAMRIRSSRIEFAWGPAGGGPPGEIGALEIALAAGPGGRGSVWIRNLRIEDRSVRAAPAVRASSALPGHPPESVLDPSPATSWRSASAGPQWLLIDFQGEREYGGLVLRWERDRRARAFRVQASSDGAAWRTVHTATRADAATSYVYLPGGESRYLRLDLDVAATGSRNFGLVAVEVRRYDFSRSIDAFFKEVAADAPRGAYPRYLYGEQTYWSPAGLPDGETCAILNEEGMVEVDRGTFSLEPFLSADGRLVTWADAAIVQTLEPGGLPIPSAEWRAQGVSLRTTAFATRTAGRAVLYVRYRVANLAARARCVALFVAARPFQVTPPWQAFQGLGGARRLARLAYRDGVLWVDEERAVVPLAPASAFRAAAFEQGAITEYLRAATLPDASRVEDEFGYASGALRFDLELAAGAARDVFLAIPFGTLADESARDLVASLREGAGATELCRAVEGWEARLGGIEIVLPPAAAGYVETLTTATAHVLVQRDGPALQPGPRRYTRSWIRDGAIMAAALLRTGLAAEAQRFARWYAGYQRPDGAVPCCVDRSGPDWLVEHDSHGELIFTVAECWRFTRDLAFARELWPAVAKAAAHIERLRATRLGPAFEAGAARLRRGLLPESASHEGYLAHPVHAYWDDFWAVRALGDAADLAAALGEPAEARRLTALRDEFRATLHESVAATIAARGLDYVPGSVEWADFDPTATANAVALLGELPFLPRAALERTFEKYLEGVRRRRAGEVEWANYSPYEVRIVGALACLGWRAAAHELAEFFLGDRRPPAWNQWPEIAWRDPRSPGHLGDVPHAWIGAEYVLAFRSMLVFERPADRALVIGAGIPAAWLAGGGEVAVRRLPTYWGRIDFTLRRAGDDGLLLALDGELDPPPGGIVLRPPLPRPLVAAEIDGTPAAFDADGVTVRQSPAEVVLRF